MLTTDGCTTTLVHISSFRYGRPRLDNDLLHDNDITLVFSPCLSVYMSLSVCLYMSVYVCMYVCLYVCVQGRQNDVNREFRVARDQGKLIVSPHWLSVCLYVCVCVYMSVYVCLYVCVQGRQNDVNREFRVARDQGKLIVSPHWLFAVRYIPAVHSFIHHSTYIYYIMFRSLETVHSSINVYILYNVEIS